MKFAFVKSFDVQVIHFGSCNVFDIKMNSIFENMQMKEVREWRRGAIDCHRWGTEASSEAESESLICAMNEKAGRGLKRQTAGTHRCRFRMKSDDTDLFRMAGGMDRVSVQSSAVLGFVSFVFEPRPLAEPSCRLLK